MKNPDRVEDKIERIPLEEFPPEDIAFWKEVATNLASELAALDRLPDLHTRETGMVDPVMDPVDGETGVPNP